MFIGRTDVEAETPILWPPDAKNQLIWKDPDAGKDWRWEEEGMTKDEMVGWHHRFNGHEFGWTLGVDDGQGGLVCCSPWGRKELDMTQWLNWTGVSMLFSQRLFESVNFSWKWNWELDISFQNTYFVLSLPINMLQCLNVLFQQEREDICTPMADSCWWMQKPSQYWKVITLQLK